MTTDWDYPRPFVNSIVVAESDIDLLGHTNNKVYGHWCEHLAWQHSKYLGVDSADYIQLKKAMVIREANYQYLAACFVGDQVETATWITACDSRLTLERKFQFIHRQSGLCLFRATWKLVCINLQTNKPTRMPHQFIIAYAPAVIVP